MQRDGRKIDKAAQQELRLRVIEQWRLSGNMTQTANAFGVPLITVRKWVGKYREGGLKSLKKDERGRPKGKELTPNQEKEVKRMITDKQPEQLKLPFGLWTRANVSELIYEQYGIRRSLTQIGRYLKEWGFTPQKPIYKAYQQQGKLVKKWLKETYPLIREEAEKTDSMIFWGDETGIRSQDVRGRSYSKAGMTPVIRKQGKQFGLTMISAVNNRGKLYFQLHRKAINSELFIDFCKRLIRVRKERIILIVDNLAAHKTKAVLEWVNANKERIDIKYLPPYSPELNPDEYLNQDVKASLSGKMRMDGISDLEEQVTDFMNSRKKNTHQVKKYFHHPKVKYAAA
jgi:transposase